MTNIGQSLQSHLNIPNWPWVKTYGAIFGWLFTSKNPIYFDVNTIQLPSNYHPITIDITIDIIHHDIHHDIP